jgi:hypothetical protein
VFLVDGGWVALVEGASVYICGTSRRRRERWDCVQYGRIKGERERGLSVG